MTATITGTLPAGRWMGGVFRQLQHWIPADAREHQTRFGRTYYAARPCHSPCTDRPRLRQVTSGWRRCQVCAQVEARAITAASVQWPAEAS